MGHLTVVDWTLAFVLPIAAALALGTARHRDVRWGLAIVLTAAGVSVALQIAMWALGIHRPFPAARKIFSCALTVLGYAAMFLASRVHLFRRAPLAFVVVGPLVFLSTVLTVLVCAAWLFHLREY